MTRKRIEYSTFAESEGCQECMGCTKRTEGCHSTCEEYLKAKLVMDLLRIELYKESSVREDVTTYQIKSMESKAKRKHPTNRYGKARRRR